jgi:hypothetical protein
MTIAPLSNTYYRPFFQAAIAPAKLIYGIFLKAIGYLLLFLGAKEWGKILKIKGEEIDSQTASIFVGLWAYGTRFLVHGDNTHKSCRGSCYWIIAEHFNHPEKPLTEIVKEFEGGTPPLAIEMAKNNLKPAQLEEKRVWGETTSGSWPRMPELDPGIYMFLIGHSKDANSHGDAHLFTLFKQGENSLLFDPDTGLCIWKDSDWKPLLDRIGSEIRSTAAGYFTLECHFCSNISS